MNTIFLMDPLETVDPAKDTSLALMVGAARAGHAVHYLPDGGLTLRDGRVEFRATRVTPSFSEPPFEVHETKTLTQDEVGAVFIRTNPPFNERYLQNTWLLDPLPGGIPVINAPRGLRTVNEKLWATQFTDITPRTLVTRDLDACQAFLGEVQEAVAKPIDQFGGTSVFLLRAGETNARVTFETLTGRGAREIIVQEYVREAAAGDKRVLLLNGEPLGAILRVHSGEDHRNNLFAGGKAEPADVTASDARIIETIRPHLLELGLHFVGIDVIGEKLIEVNVTSPTCLQEMNRFSSQHLEDRVIAFVDQLVAA